MFGMSKPKPGPKADKRAASPRDAPPDERAPDSSVEVRLVLTTAQLEKLDRLGGAAWIGRQIDKAKEKSA